MIVKCLQPVHQQLILNSLYLVVEIYVSIFNGSIKYRLIDNGGYPAIYPADKFEIVSNRIYGFGLVIHRDEIVLSPEIIISSDLNQKNIDGFWGCYFDDFQNAEQAKKVLSIAIKQISANENVLDFNLQLKD